jgi:hypothetical protein
MPIPKSVNKDFFKKWSTGMGYVLGYFAADGTMISNNRGAYFIEFNSTDRQLIDIVKKLLGSNHSVGVRNRNHKKWEIKKWKIGYRLQIGSKEIYQDLVSHGFLPNKSKIMKMPTIPKRFFGDFVRGYFDGDGCVFFKLYKPSDRKGMRWSFTSRFTSGNRRFLKDLLTLLRGYEVNKGFIYTKKRRDKTISGYELVLSHKDSVALFALMYNNSACMKLDRKYLLFKKAISTLYPKHAAVAQR